MPSFKASDELTSKPAWLTAADQLTCFGADSAETGSSGLVMHQGWTVPQGGNDNVLAQRETIACVNMTSDIGSGDDTAFGLAASWPPEYVSYTHPVEGVLTEFGNPAAGGNMALSMQYTTDPSNAPMWNQITLAGGNWSPNTQSGGGGLFDIDGPFAGPEGWDFAPGGVPHYQFTPITLEIQAGSLDGWPTVTTELHCAATNYGTNGVPYKWDSTTNPQWPAMYLYLIVADPGSIMSYGTPARTIPSGQQVIAETWTQQALNSMSNSVGLFKLKGTSWEPNN